MLEPGREYIADRLTNNEKTEARNYALQYHLLLCYKSIALLRNSKTKSPA